MRRRRPAISSDGFAGGKRVPDFESGLRGTVTETYVNAGHMAFWHFPKPDDPHDWEPRVWFSVVPIDALADGILCFPILRFPIFIDSMCF